MLDDAYGDGLARYILRRLLIHIHTYCYPSCRAFRFHAVWMNTTLSGLVLVYTYGALLQISIDHFHPPLHVPSIYRIRVTYSSYTCN